MCYEKPGPRCSGHTRTNFRAAKAKLIAANEDLKVKTNALKVAKTVEAEAALKASQEAHARATEELRDATEKYQISKEKRAEAMEAYREAKKEYDASPEGIQKNKIRSEDMSLTAEQRTAARTAVMVGSRMREEQKEALAMKQLEAAEKEARTKELIAEINSEEVQNDKAVLADFARWAGQGDRTPEYARALLDASAEGTDAETVLEVRRGVAAWQTLSPQDMKELATDKDVDVRASLAGNGNLPKSLIAKLANDPSSNVRLAVVIKHGPSLTDAQVNSLMKDKSENVRYAVARSVKNETKQLALASDTSEQSRLGLAVNNHITPRVKAKLLSDSSSKVRCSMARRNDLAPKMVQHLARSKSEDVRETIALNPSIPSEAKDGLSNDNSVRVRSAVALTTSNPAIIKRFMEDVPDVRRGVASNASLSQENIDTLLGDKDLTVATSVIMRPEVSPTKLRDIEKNLNSYHPKHRQEIARAIRNNDNASKAQRDRLWEIVYPDM